LARYKRDERGALLERSYFGKDGEPVNGKLGVHRVVSTVNDRNFPTEERYFDGSGKPALSKGAHYVRSESNAVSETVAQAWFDAQDRPVRSDVYGAASVRTTRDERGNDILLELFDEQGRPTLGKDSFASRKRRFDAHDQAIEWSYFGVRGEPVRNKHGDVVVRQQRDARGNVVLERSFDEHAAPIANEDGYHSVEIGYDERDNPISYRYADVARQPTLGKLGYAAKRLRYDGDRLVSTSYFDASDRPVQRPSGLRDRALSVWQRWQRICPALLRCESEAGADLPRQGSASFARRATRARQQRAAVLRAAAAPAPRCARPGGARAPHRHCR
jgi:hypothetical protein